MKSQRRAFEGAAILLCIFSVACGASTGSFPVNGLKGYPRSAQASTKAAAPQPSTPTSATATADAMQAQHVQTAPASGPGSGSDGSGSAASAQSATRTEPPVTYQASSPSPTSASPAPALATSEPRTYEPPLPLASTDSQPTSRGPFFAVHGVERDDVLNVRAQPGPQSPVVGELPPGTSGIITTGARQRVGPGVWREVTYGNIHGWVNERFLVEERGGETARRTEARPNGSPARR